MREGRGSNHGAGDRETAFLEVSVSNEIEAWRAIGDEGFGCKREGGGVQIMGETPFLEVSVSNEID